MILKSQRSKKYLIEKGKRALPCASIPHSKVSDLIFVFLFGPNLCVRNMVVATNPKATININAIGKKSAGVLAATGIF